MDDTLLAIIVLVMILAGIVGTILPIIPGLLLAWAGPLVYGIDHGMSTVGWIALVICTILLVVGTYLGFRIPQKDAASEGLTIPDQLLALVLAIIGAFVIPVVGLAIGFVLGVYLMRLRATGTTAAAMASTKVILVSMLKASAVQAICGVGMLATWVAWVAID
jgi:uncharacterized protein